MIGEENVAGQVDIFFKGKIEGDKISGQYREVFESEDGDEEEVKGTWKAARKMTVRHFLL